MRNFNITDKDLNGIDLLNGSANIDFKGSLPTIPIIPGNLKGAFEKITGFNNYNDINNFINNQRNYIWNEYNRAINFITEQWDYDNLPDEIDKYILEFKLLTNGIVYFVNIGNDYYAVNGSVLKYDMYFRPIEIKVNENTELFKDKIFTNFGYIRNNRQTQGLYIEVFRYIFDMEKTLFQLEKNLTSSAPKGILVNKKGREPDTEEANSKSDVFESLINQENTFAEVYVSDKDDALFKELLNGNNVNSLFIPIELTDRTENLIKNYTFLKEQLKEIIGSMVGSVNPKQERLITSETTAQQDISDNNKAHMFNIRENDIKLLNKKLGLNIKIKRIYTPEEEMEMSGYNELKQNTIESDTKDNN